MRPRKQPRCTLCTKHRWKGNRYDRHKKQSRKPHNPKNVEWEVDHQRGLDDASNEESSDPGD